MAFSDKKGINIASPFKLQAEELLDVRQKVDTIAERDELVNIHAVAPGLRVFVKANKTTYIYNGSGWDALISSANIGSQSVTTAAQLSSSAGSATQPIYFSNGKPAACSYTLGKSVPSNAVFTDTTYSDMKGATSTGVGTHGLVPAPSAGVANRYLRSDGTWAVPPNDNTTYSLGSFGITASAAEINYTKGVTSSIQTQLNSKAASSHSHPAASTSTAGFMPKLSGSTSNYLRGDGTWATPTDTDTKVTQTAVAVADYTNWRSIPWGSSNSDTEGFSPTTVTDVTYTTPNLSFQPSTGTLKATVFKGNLSGNATSADSASSATTATQLSSSAGSATQPIYFSGGKPVACSYTLGKSVPSNAVFTDTTYSDMKGATNTGVGTHGLVPAPSPGAANRYLRSDGTWAVPPNTDTTYSLSSFGITASAAEINYTKGVTSSIQTQLNNKAASSHSHPAASTSSAGFMPKLNGSTSNYLRGDGTWATPPNTDTTYNKFTGASGSAAGTVGLVPAPAAGAANRYLRSDGTWSVPPDTNTTYSLGSFGITASAAEINYTKGVTSSIQTQLNNKAASSHSHPAASTSSAGFMPKLNGSTSNYLRGDGTWATPPNTDTTYNKFTGASGSAAGTVGLVPAPAAGAANRYLRSDGTWSVPPDTNTTYSLGSFGITASATELNYMKGVTSSVQTQLNNKAASSHSHPAASTSTAGFMPKLNGSTSNYLRGDGTWATPPNTDTDTKVTNTPANTSTAYITGTTSASTNTGTQIFDTEVYLTSTPGRMHTGSLEIGGAILTYDDTNKSLTISFS